MLDDDNAREMEAQLTPAVLASFQKNDFNLFTFSQQVGRKHQLSMVGYGLLKIHNVHHLVNPQKFFDFMRAVHNRYSREVAYHNDLHGSQCALQVSQLLNQRGMNGIGLNEYDHLALLVSALCHDIGHDGFTNAFHKNLQTPRFLTFGDVAVQEGYHAATTIFLIEQREYDFFGLPMTRTARRLMKKRILCSILDTDMACSKQLFSDLQSHLEKRGIKDGANFFNFIDRTNSDTQERSKQLISSALLNAADVGACLKPFDLSQ